MRPIPEEVAMRWGRRRGEETQTGIATMNSDAADEERKMRTE
jgi:hypothetical protein